jgi:hypothetical protein
MPPQTKTVKIGFQQALQACGNESLIDTLYSLIDHNVIRSFEIEVQILVDREKAIAIENFFLESPKPTFPTKKKGTY